LLEEAAGFNLSKLSLRLAASKYLVISLRALLKGFRWFVQDSAKWRRVS